MRVFERITQVISAMTIITTAGHGRKLKILPWPITTMSPMVLITWPSV